MRFSATELLNNRRKVELNKTSEIQVTSDYDKFSFLKENRDVNEAHLKKLKKSIEVKYIPVPIIVNDNYEIIDGQHRYMACKELGLPIYYTVIKNCSLKDVHTLNSYAKKWNWIDTLQSHVKAGNEHYIIFNEVMLENNFRYDQTYRILSGGLASTVKRKLEWENGLFKIHDTRTPFMWLERFHEISKYYDNWNRRNFVFCMVFLFKHPDFDYKRFIQKLSYQSRRLVDELSIVDYMDSINKIYNYNKKGKKTYFTYGEQ